MFLSGLLRAPRKRFAGALGALMTVCLVSVCSPPGASWAKESAANVPVVELEQLPREARQTHALIHAGGPFPYRKDGIVFGNREHLLPDQARGFYREYTVPTPGVQNRGARRIVCGGKPRRAPESCFYSDDHYASFRRIVQ